MTSQTIHRGVVKLVLSGDCLVIRDRPQGGPPPERTIALSNVIAPRLARRPQGDDEGSKDEPFAWDAREFLRKKAIGREVVYTVEFKAPSGREYGYVYLGRDIEHGENLATAVVSEGLAEVRRQTNPNAAANNETYQSLILLEEAARAEGKGKWTTGPSRGEASVRRVVWTIDNPQQFVESRAGKPLAAIIEHVRDASTLRALLLPTEDAEVFYTVTVMLSGVKAPGFKMEGSKQIPEPFAEEARYFVESRLLQREVQVLLETCSNQNFLVGSVLHPNGNIGELLLKEGFARCLDWTMGVVSNRGAEAYRAAERSAKERRARIWKDFQPSSASIAASAGVTNGGGADITVGTGATNGYDSPGQTVIGKVVEVGNGDNLVVRCPNGQLRKFFLASVRPPRMGQPAAGGNGPRPRPLYDIPYMFEAREFLRKKLIGKKVSVRIDYTQPKSDTLNMEERVCATVLVGDLNVAEALVSKGLATVVRYRASDDNRSSAYDVLLAAEAVAQKKAVGMHSKKDAPTHKITDLAGEVNKSKQFLPFLKRAGRLEALVEHVAGGSRLRLYIAKETCLITLLVAGIECPRTARRLPDGGEEPGDSMGFEALQFTRDLCLQREVEVEVDTMDKGGNFIGWLFVDGSGGAAPGSGASSTNLSIALVEAGLAKVHFTAERSPYFQALGGAEEHAKLRKLGLWALESATASTTKPPQERRGSDEVGGGVETVSKGDDDQTGEQQAQRKVNYQQALVTVVNTGIRFYVQPLACAATLERITHEINSHLSEHPPLPGSFKAKRGELCAAKFSADNCWYRGRVIKEGPESDQVTVLYIDFGNEETTQASSLAPLPSGLASLPGQAVEYRLACAQLPPDEDDQAAALKSLRQGIAEKEVKLNIEHDATDSCPGKGISVLLPCTGQQSAEIDVAEKLIRDGLLMVERPRDRRLAALVKRYTAAQDQALRAHRNIWRYGDFRPDEVI